MSGLYNMLMGRNPAYRILTAFAGIHQENFQQLGRLRDAWITEDVKTVGILHRNYGEDGKAANDAAAALPTFREGGPCSDYTYGFWLFNVREHVAPIARRIAEVSDNIPYFERYKQALADMRSEKDTPQTRHMKRVGREIIESLSKSFEDGESRTVETDDGGIEIVPPKKIEKGGETMPTKNHINSIAKGLDWSEPVSLNDPIPPIREHGAFAVEDEKFKATFGVTVREHEGQWLVATLSDDQWKSHRIEGKELEGIRADEHLVHRWLRPKEGQ